MNQQRKVGEYIKVLELSNINQRYTCVIMHLARGSPDSDSGILNLSKVSQRFACFIILLVVD